MGTEIKKMNIREFREKGYLQELNRTFLHPLGLALEVSIDENTDEEYISGVWDYREDEDGIYYDLKNSSNERILRFQQNANFIQSEAKKRGNERIKNLGSIVETIPNIDSISNDVKK